MLPQLTRPPAFRVARIGSPEAQVLIEYRPDLSDCSTCRQPVWVDSDHLSRCRRHGLELICATCVAACPF